VDSGYGFDGDGKRLLMDEDVALVRAAAAAAA